ncbi:SgcJ/EcaC family oxidoreductase [Glycomyces arizonensis]|uniref:SgcJ/EcaC family oxidoreductase n=1 Tax=Glycomyces arizonensis TaxID=256035 RepID=UPI0003FD096C|nr:SgcJ/EcaC family oxidoreductase [Glycomyces arizonensis]
MDTETQAIADLIHSTAAAWGDGDARAYAEHFTADASYTTWVGTLYQGREEIARSHEALFAKFTKGTRLADEILDVRFYGADAAVVNTRGEIYKGEARPAAEKMSKVQTYTVVREEGGWKIAAFQNTKRKALMEKISFKFAPETVPAGH